MNIYLRKKGNISCDKCEKIIAQISCNNNVLKEIYGLKVICSDCEPVPDYCKPEEQDGDSEWRKF